MGSLIRGFFFFPSCFAQIGSSTAAFTVAKAKYFCQPGQRSKVFLLSVSPTPAPAPCSVRALIIHRYTGHRPGCISARTVSPLSNICHVFLYFIFNLPSFRSRYHGCSAAVWGHEMLKKRRFGKLWKAQPFLFEYEIRETRLSPWLKHSRELCINKALQGNINIKVTFGVRVQLEHTGLIREAKNSHEFIFPHKSSCRVSSLLIRENIKYRKKKAKSG